MKVQELVRSQKFQHTLPDKQLNFFDALKYGRYHPVFFAKYFCGLDLFEGFDLEKNPNKETEGVRTPERGQIGWLTQNVFTPERILSSGNRWGKSLSEAVKHLWMLIYKIRRDPRFNKIWEYRTINIAITMEQARIVWEEAVKLITSRPQLSWALDRAPTRKPFPLLTLSDGQTFTCRSTDQPANLWGPWYDFASCDEFAHEKNPNTVIPLIKTRLMDHDGLCDYLSTPGYTKGWFFQLKQTARLNPDSYYLLTGSQKENPHISSEARQRFIDGMTKEQVMVHIEGEDVDAGGLVFKHSDIETARHPDLKLIDYIDGEKYVHEDYKPGHRYIDGWDIATKKDYLVGITFDVTVRPIKLVMLERYRKIPWAYVYNRIRTRHLSYKSTMLIDTTGVGDHVPEELADLSDFIVPINFAKPKLKTQIIIAGQKRLEDRGVIFPQIPVLIQQLTFYEWDDKNLETDCVIAFCLGLYDPDIQTQTGSGSSLDIKIGDQSESAKMAADIIRSLR